MSQVLHRALDLLEHVAHSPSSLEEISRHFDVHKTTVMRLLHSLEERGFLVRRPDGTYHLGHQLFALSGAALAERNVAQAAHRHLVALNQEIGHTVHLAALEGDEVVYIDKVEPRTPVRMYSRIGLTASLNSAAVAKILIGALPPADRERYLAKADFTRHSETTLTTPEELRAAWDAARLQAWAADREEHEPMVHCVAVPVYGPDSTVWAALSVSVPSMLVPFQELLGLLPRMHAAAQSVSTDLGFRGDVPEPRIISEGKNNG